MIRLLNYRHSLIVLAVLLRITTVACSSGGVEIESSATPTATAAASPTGTPTATATPAPSPAPTFTPTPTRAPVPTSTPLPTTTPSPTPARVPTADPRYGLIVTSDDSRAFDLFGAIDYIDYTSTLDDVPEDARKVLYLNSVNPTPLEEIQTAAASAPGSVWYVLGEPNAHGVSVQDSLVGLHDAYAAIKEADPTALITSPSILNYSFNCINCGGYLHGATWITNFFFEYIDLFGKEPPIDIWAIDVFPIVWPGPGVSADEAFPTVRDDIVSKQIVEFREWVDSRESTRGDPIWITEFGLHWGFEDWEYGVEGCGGRPSPVGDYLADEVEAYLTRAYTWFEDNAEPLNLERWFTFATYKDIDRCQDDSGNGLSLLDTPDASGNLTDIGMFYYNWIRGIR